MAPATVALVLLVKNELGPVKEIISIINLSVVNEVFCMERHLLMEVSNFLKKEVESNLRR